MKKRKIVAFVLIVSLFFAFASVSFAALSPITLNGIAEHLTGVTKREFQSTPFNRGSSAWNPAAFSAAYTSVANEFNPNHQFSLPSYLSVAGNVVSVTRTASNGAWHSYPARSGINYNSYNLMTLFVDPPLGYVARITGTYYNS